MRDRVVTAGCWTMTAGLAGWALMRGLGLDRGWPLVALVAFTPYVAGAGALVVVVNALARKWCAAGVAAVALGALGLAVVPRAVGGGEEGSGRPLRVMTANLYWGKAPAEDVVRLVKRERVDVLSLQELTPRAAANLRDAGLAEVLPHEVTEPRLGGGGAGVYARIPLEPIDAPDGTVFARATARATWPGVGRVELVAVHPPAPQRPGIIAAWAQDLRALPPAPDTGSRILAGDFNATLDHRELRRVLDRGYRDAAAEAGAGWRMTWPTNKSWPPDVAIDHVLHDERWTTQTVDVIPIPGSDHRAVLAVLRPRSAP